MKNILLVFAAGCLGALIQIAAMNLANHYGLIHSLGVQLSSSYSPHWIYPRIVWGGLWGFIFLLPLLASSVFLRSIVLCLIPTAAQLFIFYPFYENKGVAGMSLGMLTPFVVLFFYWLWAFTTAISLRLAR
jgi:hypothetical protein